MSFVLNLFTDPNFQNKLGFQSSNTSEKTATAVVDTLGKIQTLIDSGKIKDGSVIRVYAKVNLTKVVNLNNPMELEVDGELMSIHDMEMADAAAEKAAETEAEPPF